MERDGLDFFVAEGPADQLLHGGEGVVDCGDAALFGEAGEGAEDGETGGELGDVEVVSVCGGWRGGGGGVGGGGVGGGEGVVVVVGAWGGAVYFFEDHGGCIY